MVFLQQKSLILLARIIPRWIGFPLREDYVKEGKEPYEARQYGHKYDDTSPQHQRDRTALLD